MSTNCSAAAVALGAPMLAANFPRAYLDVNREPWELDPRMFTEPVPSFANIRSARVAGGLGTVPKLVGEGLDIYPGRLPLAEALARIETVYKPYHDALKRLLTRTHAALRLCGAGRLPFDAGQHSRSASPACGPTSSSATVSASRRRAGLTETAPSAFCIRWATRSPTTSPMPAASSPSITAGRREACMRIQIEINRGLYMNERTLQKSSGFRRWPTIWRGFRPI